MAPSIAKPESGDRTPPYVDGVKVLIDGAVRVWDGECTNVISPLFQNDGTKIVIGKHAVFTKEAAVAAVDAAARSWNRGRGEWARKSMEQRILAVERFVEALQEKRGEIVEILQWEICKNDGDAAKEFDRTMEFIAALIKHLREIESNEIISDSGIHAKMRRSPVGVMLNLGPVNYPFNETYATLIPGILCGNSVVMKLPNIGGLAHVLTMEAFASCFPKGVVNFVAGRGRDTMPPIMETGKVDIFAFIGSSNAADALVKVHPAPHRLRTFLSLDAKNLGIVMPDADINLAVKECLTGSTSFNGQRCTAIKLITVHKSIATQFCQAFKEKIVQLSAGPPFGANPITPLPEPNKPQYLQELIEDAKGKGADIINECGGQHDRTLFFPAVVYPVTKEMRLYHEEQFGPVVAIAEYEDITEVLDHMAESNFGQQVALFTGQSSGNSKDMGRVLDACALATCRVNINSQCQRGPDTFPFAGRKSSALGTISVSEVFRAFSVETLVAAKSEEAILSLVKESAVFAHVSKEAVKPASIELVMPAGDTVAVAEVVPEAPKPKEQEAPVWWWQFLRCQTHA